VPDPAGPGSSAPHLIWDGDAASDDSAAHFEDRLAGLAGALGPLRRLLACVAERLIETKAHQRLCYARLGDYARERLGLSARQLQELARVHRALTGLPAVDRALLTNELPWSKVRLLARVATGEDEEAWIARAREMPTRRLEQEVRRSARDDEPQDADDPALEKRVTVRCTPAVREKWGLAREMAERVAGQRLRAGEALELVAAEVAALFCAVRETVRSRLGAEGRRLLGDGEVFDAMLECALLAWTLRDPRARRTDPVMERDGYRCAVPGCTSRCSLHDHHVIFRSAGGSDAPDNRVTLCAFHHQRCLHAGRLGVKGRAPDALVFELGLRPGADPLVRYRSGDIVVRQGDSGATLRPRRAA